MTAPVEPLESFDVLIVGAGLSGIDTACRLKEGRPRKSFVILEARLAIGGTWDLFRFPGIRSDSDMPTFGFPFRPFRGRMIADGASIQRYIEETARAFGIDRHIRFGHRVVSASWSSDEARWTVEVETDAGRTSFIGRFLSVCSGYYDYQRGYEPVLPGADRFAGPIIHPQHWPEDLALAGKRVVVIGSGATAVTLVPELAKRGADVTMLQRSPSYILAMPSVDPIGRWLGKLLPPGLTDRLVRWKNIAISTLIYGFARRRPAMARRMILKRVSSALGPGHDVERDFGPAYNVWDQRLCLVPDGDLFAAIRKGRASVVTDTIEAIAEHGIRLSSGRTIDADVIVTATGLAIKVMGGIAFDIDGSPQDLSTKLIYKGMMLSGVPNFAFGFGYTNASWTLKCDLSARYVVRLLEYMDSHGFASATPVPGRDVEPRPMVNFTSGYVKRAEAMLPRQGSRAPWRLHQNYLRDWAGFSFGRIEDGVMQFATEAAPHKKTPQSA